jgi:hypothetical protein
MKNKLVFVLIFAIFLSSNFVLAEDISVKDDTAVPVKNDQENKNIKDGPRFFIEIGIENYNNSLEWRSYHLVGGDSYYRWGSIPTIGQYFTEEYDGVSTTWGIGALLNNKIEIGLNVSGRNMVEEDYYTLKSTIVSLENKYLIGTKESKLRPYFGFGVNFNSLKYEEYYSNFTLSSKDSFLSFSLMAGLKIYSSKNRAFDFYFKHTPATLFELDAECVGYSTTGFCTPMLVKNDVKMTLGHSEDSFGIKMMFYVQ